MNHKKFLRHLTGHGCSFERHGGGHDLWRSGGTGSVTAVPRHKEVDPDMVKVICKQLGVPPPREK